MSWFNPFSAIVDAVVNFFAKKEETKQLVESAKAKLASAKLTSATDITLTDAEAEVMLAKQMDSSWKDEYSLLLITSPLLLIVIGAVVYVFIQDPRLMDAGLLAITKMQEAGVDMATLMNAVIFASIGLKFWRSK